MILKTARVDTSIYLVETEDGQFLGYVIGDLLYERLWVNKKSHVCAYCHESFPTEKTDDITAHITTCEKHPMRPYVDLVRRLAQARESQFARDRFQMFRREAKELLICRENEK